jgi:predicted acetyltransferase
MERVTLTVRRLSNDDAEASRQLGFEAFGVPTSPPTDPATVSTPGRRSFGAFDGDTLAARMSDREYDSYFGGAVIPTAGIAGVTVAVEYRGRGALSPLFAETLKSAKQRGAAVSTLFPTAPRIYRKFGYEVVADYFSARVPSHVLATVRPASSVWTRRAREGDFDAIRLVYDSWARVQNGPLSRRGASFTATAQDFLGAFTGVTVAVDGSGTIHGFASWNRGQGYGENATLEVHDLLASSAEGYRALLAAMGSSASVTPNTVINTSGADIARTFLPSLHWQVTESTPYMLKILDVQRALSGRHYLDRCTVSLPFRLAGDFLGENNGGYELAVASGRGQCSHQESDAGRTFTPHGLAMTYAGIQSSANLRAAGHLVGGDLADDPVWDALFGGQQAHIRDYF